MAKICMLAYTFYSYDPRVLREAEALKDRGDQVDFICLNDFEKGNEKEENVNGVNVYKINIKKYQGSNSIFYILSYFNFFIKSFFKLTFLYIRRKYDVIHIHTMPDFLVFAALIPKIFGAKIILDVHDLMPELYISKFKFKEKHIIIKLLIFIEKASINFANKAIAVHKTHLDALISHNNKIDKFITLLNVPDPKIFYKIADNMLKNKKEYIILYHGTVSKRHGIEILIKAINEIKDKIKNIRLRVIGNGEDVKRLINIVNDFNLQDNVYFNEKFVQTKDLVEEINNSNVCIVPIIYDKFTKYMLPTKMIEAILIGKPVIVTRTNTIETYFDDGMVIYFESGNFKELAEKILYLYNNQNIIKKLNDNNKKFIDVYNWENHRKILYELVDSLVKKK